MEIITTVIIRIIKTILIKKVKADGIDKERKK
jgi:hypothetical protein